ncbi:MAG: hypothetical protein ACTSXJ_09990 [Candidatus Baldrarchaeia archaeon]|mgnify:CR=1 FL=1
MTPLAHSLISAIYMATLITPFALAAQLVIRVRSRRWRQFRSFLLVLSAPALWLNAKIRRYVERAEPSGIVKNVALAFLPFMIMFSIATAILAFYEVLGFLTVILAFPFLMWALPSTPPLRRALESMRASRDGPLTLALGIATLILVIAAVLRVLALIS